MPSYPIVAVARQRSEMTLDALARRAGMHPALVEQIVEFGLIVPSGRQAGAPLFDPSALGRLRVISHMRDSLGINLAGISVILDLLDKVGALQRANDRLRQVR